MDFEKLLESLRQSCGSLSSRDLEVAKKSYLVGIKFGEGKKFPERVGFTNPQKNPT